MSFARRGFLAAGVAILALALRSTAIADVWSSVGPGGGSVFCLGRDSVHPAVLYAGTGRNGLFKTTDSGGHWMPIARAVSDKNVRAIVVDPGNPDTVYMATAGNGVFKSTDGGVTWGASNSGMTDLRLNALAMDPSNPAVLYAGTNLRTIYKSVNGGATWISLTEGLQSWGYWSFAIDPTDPATIYAGTGSGVFRSTDGGQNWLNVSKGLLIGSLIVDLVVLPGSPTVVLAAAAGLGQGIGRTLDGGSTWDFIPIGTGVVSLAVEPGSSLVVYAGSAQNGVFKSVDAGATWGGIFSPFDFYGPDLAFDSASPANLYAAVASGVFLLSNQGWLPRGAGITNVAVYSIAFDAASSRTVYAGTDVNPLYRSIDGGETWVPTLTGMVAGSGIASDPAVAGTLYLFTGTLLKSVNGGTSWSPADSGLPPGYRIFRTVVDPFTTSTLYVGTTTGVYKSVNGGSSWSLMDTGLGTPQVAALAVDPGDHQTVYAGILGAGVFKSVNGGASWSSSSEGLTDLSVWSLAVDPANSSVIYAGTEVGGVFKSENGGAAWLPMNTGLAVGKVRELVADSREPGLLYAAVEGSGVFLTVDAGLTWRAFNENLTHLAVLSLALTPSGSLYAGTYGGGAFVRRVGRSSFYTLTPCRLFDTRDPASVPGALPLAANSERTFAATSRCGVPPTARSLAVNLTVINPTATGHVTLFPAGAPLPTASSINYSAGRIRSSNGIVGLGTSGSFTARCVQASGTVDLIVDVSGYFE